MTPVKVKVEATVKTEKHDSSDAKESPSKDDANEEKVEAKPKINPFFTKMKEVKLQSSEGTSDGSSYDPGKANYNPIKDCFWKHGEKYVTFYLL